MLDKFPIKFVQALLMLKAEGYAKGLPLGAAGHIKLGLFHKSDAFDGSLQFFAGTEANLQTIDGSGGKFVLRFRRTTRHAAIKGTKIAQAFSNAGFLSFLSSFADADLQPVSSYSSFLLISPDRLLLIRTVFRLTTLCRFDIKLYQHLILAVILETYMEGWQNMTFSSRCKHESRENLPRKSRASFEEGGVRKNVEVMPGRVRILWF